MVKSSLSLGSTQRGRGLDSSRNLCVLLLFASLSCGGGQQAVDSGDEVRGVGSHPEVGRTGIEASGALEGRPGNEASQSVAMLWRRQVVYLVLTDRFFNGSPENDELGVASCFDPAAPGLFHGGDLAGLRQRLGYLTELGVSTLWLTPLYRQVPRLGDTCGYHGYWPDFSSPDDAGIEPRLGDEEELAELATALEGAGLWLIFDLIVNHAGYGAEIVTSHPDWFHVEEECAELGEADIYCPVSGLPDFAQEREEVRDYLTTSSRRWIERTPISGIRMDTAKHVEVSFFEQHWIPAVRRARPGLFLIAEVFSGDSSSQYVPFLDAGFDSAFNFVLRAALLESFARQGSVNHVADAVADTIDTLGLERALLMVNFLDNHDVPRFMEEAEAVSEAVRAASYRLALVALMTLPGIPQLYAGDELGLMGRYPDNRRSMPDWAWGARERAVDHDGALPGSGELFELTARLTRLRRARSALADGRYVELHRQERPEAPNLLVYLRISERDAVVVAINNDEQPSGPIHLSFDVVEALTNGEREIFGSGAALVNLLSANETDSLELEEGGLTIALPRRSAALWGLEE